MHSVLLCVPTLHCRCNTLCKSSVLRGVLTPLMLAQCTSGTRGAHLVHDMCVPRAPAAHCYAEQLRIATMFSHRIASMEHSCAPQLRFFATFWHINVQCRPMWGRPLMETTFRRTATIAVQLKVGLKHKKNWKRAVSSLK